jgi:hypothetical protein
VKIETNVLQTTVVVMLTPNVLTPLDRELVYVTQDLPEMVSLVPISMSALTPLPTIATHLPTVLISFHPTDVNVNLVTLEMEPSANWMALGVNGRTGLHVQHLVISVNVSDYESVPDLISLDVQDLHLKKRIVS